MYHIRTMVYHKRTLSNIFDGINDLLLTVYLLEALTTHYLYDCNQRKIFAFCMK